MTDAERRAALVEMVAIAAMKDNGCGLTVDGRHVLCCDKSVVGKVGAYGEELYQKPENCSCYTMATTALTVALEEAARCAEPQEAHDDPLTAHKIATAIRALIPDGGFASSGA